MCRSFLLIVLILLMVACMQPVKTQSHPDSTTFISSGNITEKKDEQLAITADSSEKWMDTLLENYIMHSANPLLVSIKDKQRVSWMFDREENSDSAVYNVFQVGHHVSDEGGQNPRYVADQWIYINQRTRQLYEYDVVNDSLIRWPK